MTWLILTITNLKDRVLGDVCIDDTATTLELKTRVGHMAGILAGDACLIFRGTCLADDTARLYTYGISCNCQLRLYVYQLTAARQAYLEATAAAAAAIAGPVAGRGSSTDGPCTVAVYATDPCAAAAARQQSATSARHAAAREETEGTASSWQQQEEAPRATARLITQAHCAEPATLSASANQGVLAQMMHGAGAQRAEHLGRLERTAPAMPSSKRQRGG